MSTTTPYTTRSGLKIGSQYVQPQRWAETTLSEDRVQAALLAWRRKAANDSRVMIFAGDMHPLAAQRRREREQARQRKRTRRSLRKTLRAFLAMLLAPRAPRVRP